MFVPISIFFKYRMLSCDFWGGIKLCSVCDSVGYCSDHCREEDRERHRTECALVSLSKRKQYPHRAWFLARACLRVQEEGYDVPDRINSRMSRCFGDLMDRKCLSGF